MTIRLPGSAGSSPRAMLEQAVSAHRAGRLEEAERLYRAALKLDRSIPDAHHLLASVLGAQQRYDEALTAIKRALKLDARRAQFHSTHAGLQLGVGHFGRARDAYRRAAELEPNAAGHRFNLALALDRAGDLDAAVAEYRHGASLAPQDVRIRINLGEALLRAGRAEEAVEALEYASRLDPSQLGCWMNLARARREFGDVDRVIACYRQALRIAPNDPRIHTSLGQVLREAGRLDDAVTALRQAIACAPDMPEPRITLAMTRKHTERDSEVAWIEELARDPAARGARAPDALFAHAKILEDLGEHDAAFGELERANRARRATFEYSVETDAALFARIRGVFTPERVAALRGFGGAEDATPILILGMPRSGTSLVEQILASHPDVVGVGETMHAPAVLDALPGGYPAAFDAIDAAGLRAAGERLVELLRREAPSAQRIVDKLPMNFVRLGGLRAILPHATIVHCVRDARDTGLSIFRQNFEQDLGFAFDLAEIGRFHRLYQELMTHWRAVLGPDDFLDVVYEDLVADLEGGVRRILAHCGLEFDPACLAFHRTERSVKTASLQQVRQPIYSSSVGAWRRWEGRLGPLLEALGPDGLAAGEVS